MSTAGLSGGSRLEDQPRTGSPKLLTGADDRRLLAGAIAKASTRVVARQLSTPYRPLSQPTVWRAVRALPRVYRIRKKKPFLRRMHKVARMAFARTRFPRRYWQRVASADESAFTLSLRPRGAWVQPGQTPRPRQILRHTPYIRVWAGVSWWGKTKLYKIPRNMTGDRFAEFAQRKAIYALLQICGPIDVTGSFSRITTEYTLPKSSGKHSPSTGSEKFQTTRAALLT